ncbi:MAG: calcium/sodium antiporter [Candidatus Thermoplasmatota archaeon]|nr:calcium/sodium antiporter [Candidatus Thermoplasmatota archaeon]MDD5777930.1 calcium/sodium antiporter [Candidatus Thermoplasmatota archaeon]
MADAAILGAELVLGIVLLVKGSDMFVDGAAALAHRFGISEHLIGLTLVAFATSLPELAVSSVASFNGEAGIALGNVVGSNIANICLILGVAALIMTLSPSGETRRDGLFMVGVAALLALLYAWDRRIDIYDSLIFLGLYAYYIYYLYRAYLHPRRREKKVTESLPPQDGYAREAVLVGVGAGGVVLGAHWLVEAGVGIAEWLGISSLVIGLTMVAFGTSIPELASSVAAALKQRHGIAVGNVIGSNILNVLLVLGVAGAIRPIGGGDKLVLTLPFLLLVSVLLVVLTRREIKKWAGVLLLSLYGVFLALLLV